MVEIFLLQNGAESKPQKLTFDLYEVFGHDVAKKIGADKSAVAIEVHGEIKDLSSKIPHNSKVRMIMENDSEGLHIIRHSTAHILAEAVRELFPDVRPAIGPVIENGFYYDFKSERPFTEDDLKVIEAKMQELVERDQKFVRSEQSRNDALEMFMKKDEPFKQMLVQKIPENEKISIYQQGSFVDLCRGPHIPSTGRLKGCFALTKVAGAYWLGDHNNEQLQRIYGTAWHSNAALKEHLANLEEAEKRNHIKLGKEMALFHTQEEAPGCVFWHPNGWIIYQEIISYMRKKLSANGYSEVNTPHIVSKALWEQSGHWEKFRDVMFLIEQEKATHGVKPMNCPCHIQIFKKGPKCCGLTSYKDLPIRMAEFGSCSRNEPSGSLYGIMRVRSFVQDDAHIFCSTEQIVEETIRFCSLLREIYKDFGFCDIIVRLATRPEKRLGSNELWDKAERSLMEASDASGLLYTIFPGEGAFYGPKLEFVLKDSLGRLWQCGTFQIDFVLPDRMGAHYIAEDGKKKHPVMLHRAILGSLERFIGILLENYGGWIPLWLSPIQVSVATISEAFVPYGEKVVQELLKAGLRVERDFRNEKISYKIRELHSQKVPCIFVVGAKEEASEKVCLRAGETQKILGLQEAIDLIKKVIAEKSVAKNSIV
ncbi:threonine--tRNA ligase [Candidatus Hydrogenosomobacter endosymbioticus]|uniref:Threonine--tRNA ligase n=1 Tax=Candidatus Hydrogenosomobacter endosymbioticus TaxID=2558174 RepID=A0ABM7V9R9_9PROT|nr:threonine--tRNA ligase [Candidatus Hydrogenosomobacter endosymbioticus]BDB96256.1 threonine--tRNA ligase [Candidatus Hydrogenosomobacter endosymbioticus]